MLSKKDLKHFEKLIIAKRDELLKSLGHLKDQGNSANNQDGSGENSSYSFHMADQGTDNMEREKSFFFAGREGKLLPYLERALDRIKEGTYGLCADCVEEQRNLCKTCPYIPKERLEAVPHATLCVECKTSRERNNRR